MSVSDPYGVLGIDPSATDDEVKAAYREMAKKYHPDNYSDNPLSDLAQQKMQEINEAYDAIVRMRQRTQAGGGNGAYGYNPSAGGGNSQYFDIRNMIRSGRVIDAETLLDGMPAASRDAEWFFLKGSVLYKKGWLEEAHSHFSQAVQLDPDNMEYRNSLDHMNMQRRTGGYRTGNGQGTSCSMCDCCAGMMCADVCCRCMC